MSTFSKLYYHLIFSTKGRVKAIKGEREVRIHNCLKSILNDKNCLVIFINGTDDHIHILLNIPLPTNIPDLIRDIKSSSTKFIKSKIASNFPGWQKNYSIFTVSYSEKERVIDYIANQKEHHHKLSFEVELKSILDKLEIEYKDEYLFED